MGCQRGGNIITVYSKRFLCPEMPFQPGFVKKEAPATHDTKFLSIKRCDVDIRKDF